MLRWSRWIGAFLQEGGPLLKKIWNQTLRKAINKMRQEQVSTMPSNNHARQPTPVERQACSPTLSARRGCADRSAKSS